MGQGLSGPASIGRYNYSACCPRGFQPSCCCGICVFAPDADKHPAWGLVEKQIESMLPEAERVVFNNLNHCRFACCGGCEQTMYAAAEALNRDWVPQANRVLEMHGLYCQAVAEVKVTYNQNGRQAQNILSIKIYEKNVEVPGQPHYQLNT